MGADSTLADSRIRLMPASKPALLKKQIIIDGKRAKKGEQVLETEEIKPFSTNKAIAEYSGLLLHMFRTVKNAKDSYDVGLKWFWIVNIFTSIPFPWSISAMQLVFQITGKL